VTLLAVGVSHRTAPLALRERLALTERRAAALLASLIELDAVEEAATLSTCNRTELYLVASDGGDAARTLLAQAGAMRPEELGTAVRTLRGPDAVRHLFRVTAGLDSMVVGEAEIQGQVRRAYELGLSLGTSGRIVNRLFQDALRAGKRARSETSISRHGASVASVALELARRELGDLRGRRALVIGAGKQGTLTARALRDAGVRTVFVASRAHERAEGLARRFGGTAVDFADLAGELGRCDLVLTGTSCPHPVVTRRELASAAEGRKVLVLDTAVPRDVEPSARDLAGVTLYDLDDIQRQIGRNLSFREQEAARAEPIIEEELERFQRWLETLEVVPTISALRERGRVAVERALRENEPRWQSLTDDDRDRVELIARAVVSDLLHEPTLSLRRASRQGSSSHYVETVRELFGLSARVPTAVELRRSGEGFPIAD
jgi:glutamyl-tRNA reductase